MSGKSLSVTFFFFFLFFKTSFPKHTPIKPSLVIDRILHDAMFESIIIRINCGLDENRELRTDSAKSTTGLQFTSAMF